MISFDKLWKTMRAKGISQYALIKKHHISPSQITRLKRNESVSTHTIDVFCDILNCDVSDIMEHHPSLTPFDCSSPDLSPKSNTKKEL